MLRLDDFYHLPQLNPLIDRMIRDERPGVRVIAGLEIGAQSALAECPHFLPSSRSTLFDILLYRALSANPAGKALYLHQPGNGTRAPRALRRQVRLEEVASPDHAARLISSGLGEDKTILALDALDEKTAPAVFAAAKRGVQVFAQVNTLLWGNALGRHIASWNLPAEVQALFTWQISIHRLPALCPHCRMECAVPAGEPPLPEGIYYQPGGCACCHGTGLSGDVLAFDVTQHGAAPARLRLEDYLLMLAQCGKISVDLYRHYADDCFRHMVGLLNAKQAQLIDSTSALQRKLAELEAANQVLLKRTEVLFSLQDMIQTLTTSTHLEELAQKVISRATALSEADRAVLYYLHQEQGKSQTAEVLAVSGWQPELIHQQFAADDVMRPYRGAEPVVCNGKPPPGVQLQQVESQVSLRAGLGVPLVAHEGRVGLMVVHSTRQRQFSPGAVMLLQTFAGQAALAIQRAALIEELRGKICALEAAQVELVEKERLEHELALARQVQQSVLPREFPQYAGYQFAARNEPARQVGGDFYDVIALDANRFGLVIGDVSDKGMPAALYMALTRSLIVAESRRASSPRAVLENVNRLLMELGRPNQYVSAFYAVVDCAARTMVYSRAGHDRPLLLRGGRVHPLAGKGVVLGVMEESDLALTEEAVTLNPGDTLVLFTDGLQDAVNVGGEFYSLERFQSLLDACRELSPNQLCQAVFTAIAEFQGGTAQYDDMTLLVMHVA